MFSTVNSFIKYKARGAENFTWLNIVLHFYKTPTGGTVISVCCWNMFILYLK